MTLHERTAGYSHVSISERPPTEVAAQSRSPLCADVLLGRRWRFVACQPRHRSGTERISFRHHRGRVRGTAKRTAGNPRSRLYATQESKVRSPCHPAFIGFEPNQQIGINHPLDLHFEANHRDPRDQKPAENDRSYSSGEFVVIPEAGPSATNAGAQAA